MKMREDNDYAINFDPKTWGAYVCSVHTEVTAQDIFNR